MSKPYNRLSTIMDFAHSHPKFVAVELVTSILSSNAEDFVSKLTTSQPPPKCENLKSYLILVNQIDLEYWAATFISLVIACYFRSHY